MLREGHGAEGDTVLPHALVSARRRARTLRPATAMVASSADAEVLACDAQHRLSRLLLCLYETDSGNDGLAATIEMIGLQLDATGVSLYVPSGAGHPNHAIQFGRRIPTNPGGFKEASIAQPGSKFSPLPEGVISRQIPLNHLGDRMDVVGADIELGPGRMAQLRASRARDSGRFADADIQYLQALLPHLRNVLCKQERKAKELALTEAIKPAFDSTHLSVAVLDARGMVLKMNNAARNLLSAHPAFRLEGGAISCAVCSESRKLWNAIKRALPAQVGTGGRRNARLIVAPPSGHSRVSIRIRPIAIRGIRPGLSVPGVALYMRGLGDIGPVSDCHLRDLFGLSYMEACLARAIAEGASLLEASERLGIRHSTVRSHLRAVFRKVGVKRQTSLVRVILTSIAAIE